MNPPQSRNQQQPTGSALRTRWLNRTVFGIGLASLLSDWSHEVATAVMPAFLATMGAAAAWLGIIEGVSDGLSSFAKMGSGYFTDQMRRRKPIAVAGYVVTTMSTACIGLATQAWHVLLCRASAWLGRGVRTPVRKALLAAAVTPATYGRAFGFERMMDTCGAIIGPVTATILLAAFAGNYSRVLLITLIPGLLAAAALGFLVDEKERVHVKYLSFRTRLTALPKPFQRFLLAVGLFGAGDFAHTMLILLATQKLTPQLGAAKAAGVAVSLYVLHNVLYAGFAFVAGWLADHFNKRALLAGGYALAAAMGLVLVFAPMNLGTLVVVFAVAGVYVATEEALEDSLAAELVDKEHHGMGFGMLATVNGVGDFVSSIVVGALWTAWGTQVAFAYSTLLFAMGAAAMWFLRKA
jgi:MFS family permease